MAENRQQLDSPHYWLRWQKPRSVLAVLAVLLATGCEPEETLYSMPGTEDLPPTAATQDKPKVAAKPVAAKSSRIEDKTFDDIKFDIEPDAPYYREMLTEEIEDLVGQRIRIRGYIYPTMQRDGLKAFVLVRDNQECCFGPGAALYDCIRVEMNPGRTASFSTKPVSVEGEFQIDPLEFDGVTRAVFLLKGEKVK